LTGPRAARFLDSFLPFQQRVAKLGMINSLSQVLLKLVSPGVPDFYQGTELWDFSLVDPDNRRPVDFAHRLDLLSDLEPLLPPMSEDGVSMPSGEDRMKVSSRFVSRITEMLDHWEDGRIKLLLISAGLRLRRRNPQVFQEGEYLALSATGEKADHVVAIVRRQEDRMILAVAPRLVASFSFPPSPKALPEPGVRLPIGVDFWGDTYLDFHYGVWVDSLQNLLTGERIPLDRVSRKLTLNIGNALSICPVALLQPALGGE